MARAGSGDATVAVTLALLVSLLFQLYFVKVGAAWSRAASVPVYNARISQESNRFFTEINLFL